MKRFPIFCAIISAIFAGACFPNPVGFTANILIVCYNLWAAGFFDNGEKK